MADEIIKELWRIKDGIAHEFGNDVKALVAYLKTRKYEGDYKVVDLQAIKQTAEKKGGLDQG